PVSSCGRRCDRAWRLCRCVRTTWPWCRRIRVSARPRVRPSGNHREVNLTSEQQTKVQPILDQAKPQIAAIHQEAMQKAKTVIDSTLSQIRPLLNADQQTKLDAIQKAHQGMMNARKELHEAIQE